MRKYVSLGSALIMGVVIGKDTKKPAYETLAEAPSVLGLDHLPPSAQTVQIHLKRAYSIPSVDNDFNVQRGASPVTSEGTSDATSAKEATSEGTSDATSSAADAADSSATTSNGTLSPASPAEMPKNVKIMTEIYCGVNVNAVPGYQFYCLDAQTGRLHYCVGRQDWRYQCWTGQEWEWGNYNEHDGTPDGSWLTSLQTDNLPGTSPSPYVMIDDFGYYKEDKKKPEDNNNNNNYQDSEVTSHCDRSVDHDDYAGDYFSNDSYDGYNNNNHSQKVQPRKKDDTTHHRKEYNYSEDRYSDNDASYYNNDNHHKNKTEGDFEKRWKELDERDRKQYGKGDHDNKNRRNQTQKFEENNHHHSNGTARKNETHTYEKDFKRKRDYSIDDRNSYGFDNNDRWD